MQRILKTAIVHDWLITMGGAEKTLQSIWELYPSPIYTLMKDDLKLSQTFFSDKKINTSFLQKFPYVSKLYRNYLPLFPRAIERFDLGNYEVVISSSHTAAKGIKTHQDQLHICYCHTPMRYAWDLYPQYMEALKGWRKSVAPSILRYLRNWDAATAPRVDHFIANSQHVSQRIKKNYSRESTVIYPPVEVDLIPFRATKAEFYLTVSRLVSYKKVDLIVESFGRMPEKKLVVIGEGPELIKIKSKAKKNIEILGYQSDAIVRDYLSKAKAFVFAALEDFGMTPVEAQAAGTPVIAFGKGGALETVVENITGTFFSDQTPESLIEAIERFETQRDRFDPLMIKQHAEKFSAHRFRREFKQFVEQKIHENPHSCRR